MEGRKPPPPRGDWYFPELPKTYKKWGTPAFKPFLRFVAGTMTIMGIYTALNVYFSRGQSAWLRSLFGIDKLRPGHIRHVLRESKIKTNIYHMESNVVLGDNTKDNPYDDSVTIIWPDDSYSSSVAETNARDV